MGSYQTAMDNINEAKNLLQKAYNKIVEAEDEGVKAWETLSAIEDAQEEAKALEHSTELLWEKWQNG